MKIAQPPLSPPADDSTQLPKKVLEGSAASTSSVTTAQTASATSSSSTAPQTAPQSTATNEALSTASKAQRKLTLAELEAVNWFHVLRG